MQFYSVCNICTKLLTKAKIAPAVKELYEAGQRSTRQLMEYFQIGSRRTLYKILRFAGCSINASPAGAPPPNAGPPAARSVTSQLAVSPADATLGHD